MNILSGTLWFNFYHEGAQRGFTKEARRIVETRETRGQGDKKIQYPFISEPHGAEIVREARRENLC